MTDPVSQQHARERSRLLSLAAKGGALAFAGILVGKALAVLLQIVVSRVFGAQSYGLYITGLMVTEITQILAALGLQKGAMRFLSIAHEKGDVDQVRRICNMATLLPFAVGVLTGGLLYIAAPPLSAQAFRDPAMLPVLRRFAFAIPFFAVLRVNADLSRGFKITGFAVLVEDFLFIVLQIGLFLLFHSLGIGLYSVMYAFLCSAMVSAVAMQGFVRLQIRWEREETKQQDACHGFFPGNSAEILRYSLPLMPIALIAMMYFFSDIIMLNILADAAQVGIYAAAARLIALFTTILLAMNLIFGPLMAGRIGADDREHIRLLYRSMTRWMYFIILPVAVGLMIARQPIMALFGEAFVSGGSTVLGVLLFAGLFSVISGGSGVLLVVGGRQYIELGFLAAGLALNVLLNLLWIPTYGILGAAIATTSSRILIDIVRIIAVQRIWRCFPFGYNFLWPTIAAVFVTLAAMVLVHAAGLGYLLQILLAIMVAAITATVCLLKGLAAEDRRLFEAIKVSRHWKKLPNIGKKGG